MIRTPETGPVPILCPTAEHLRNCGECADEIERIFHDHMVAFDLQKAQVAKAEEGKPSGLMVSHADIPNAQDHPVEATDKCGICIAKKRQAGRPGQPANPNVITQFEQL